MHHASIGSRVAVLHLSAAPCGSDIKIFRIVGFCYNTWISPLSLYIYTYMHVFMKFVNCAEYIPWIEIIIFISFTDEFNVTFLRKNLRKAFIKFLNISKFISLRNSEKSFSTGSKRNKSYLLQTARINEINHIPRKCFLSLFYSLRDSRYILTSYTME